MQNITVALFYLSDKNKLLSTQYLSGCGNEPIVNCRLLVILPPFLLLHKDHSLTLDFNA